MKIVRSCSTPKKNLRNLSLIVTKNTIDKNPGDNPNEDGFDDINAKAHVILNTKTLAKPKPSITKTKLHEINSSSAITSIKKTERSVRKSSRTKIETSVFGADENELDASNENNDNKLNLKKKIKKENNLNNTSAKVRSKRAAIASVDDELYKEGDEDEDNIIVEIDLNMNNNDDYDYVSNKSKKRRAILKKSTIETNAKSKAKSRKKDVRMERIKSIMNSDQSIEALPGRSEEFDWIKRTVLGLLESSLGGCLYISGVPGTGKTATTHKTLDSLSLSALRGECRDFDFVEINGMRLSDPGQAYSILSRKLLPSIGKGVPSTGALALKKLENHFKLQQKSKLVARPCIVLLDELDLLLKKQQRQSILYHFFEWPNWTNSQLIVITIANTMDLPERFLSNRISSRLGLTRYNFKPYDFNALTKIIEHQLKDYVQYLGKNAIELCARKVSAVSGDARRAVNLAKRAVDYFRSCTQEELFERTTGRKIEKISEGSEVKEVNLKLMDMILKEALAANPVKVISQLSKHQRLLLLSVVLSRKKIEEEAGLRGETKIIGRTGISSNILTINRVLDQHFQLCRTHQFHPLPALQELYNLLESLEALRLLKCVRFREAGPDGLVQLLIHEEDIRKGLGDDQALKKYLCA